jgi:hypothetical protein
MAGKKTVRSWMTKLHALPASHELNDDDVRQLLFDLESAYNEVRVHFGVGNAINLQQVPIHVRFKLRTLCNPAVHGKSTAMTTSGLLRLDFLDKLLLSATFLPISAIPDPLFHIILQIAS